MRWELWRGAVRDSDMGTQQVSGLFCARTETEGKGAGYLFCSPEVPGTGGLRMLSNNPLLLDNGGGSSCIQGILNTKLAETIDMVLSDLVNFDKDSSVCSPCLCVRVSTPIPAACDQKSAQWNCSSCSRVMAYESCHSVWGLISLLLALSRVFSLCARQLACGLHV